MGMKKVKIILILRFLVWLGPGIKMVEKWLLLNKKKTQLPCLRDTVERSIKQSLVCSWEWAKWDPPRSL